jgi:hypothetical protein
MASMPALHRKNAPRGVIAICVRVMVWWGSA